VTTTVVYPDEPLLVATTNMALANGGSLAELYARAGIHDGWTVEQVSAVAADLGTTAAQTFATTPTVGNQLIAVVSINNVTALSSGTSGWGAIAKSNASGRSIEIWAKPTAVGDETGFSATCASGQWECTLMEVSGPINLASGVIGSHGTTSATSAATASHSATAQSARHHQLLIGAIAWGNTVSDITVAKTGTHQKTITGSVVSGARSSVAWGLMFRDSASTETGGFSWSWTTNRTSAIAIATISGVGAAPNVAPSFGFTVAGVDGTANTYTQSQHDETFDTSSVGADTVSASTLNVTTISSGDSSPAQGNPTLEARALGNLSTFAFNLDDENGPLPLTTPTETAALPLLATIAGDSYPGTINTAVDLTSEAGFPAAINTSGHTAVRFVTDDYTGEDATGTGIRRFGFFASNTTGTASDPKLTIVHAGASTQAPRSAHQYRLRRT